MRSSGDELAVAASRPAAVRPLLDLYAPSVRDSAGGRSRSRTSARASTVTSRLRRVIRITSPARTTCCTCIGCARCRDAVVVGADTVARDDPQLTVRHVEGAQTPCASCSTASARLGTRRVFTDGAAPTLVVHAEGVGAPAPGKAEVLHVPAEDGRLKLDVLLARLHERGLPACSSKAAARRCRGFLEAGLLDRLHIAIAPLVTGSGRPGLTLPARERIADCLRPAHRVFTMGGDVLFDCDLRAAATAPPSGTLTRAI